MQYFIKNVLAFLGGAGMIHQPSVFMDAGCWTEFSKFSNSFGVHLFSILFDFWRRFFINKRNEFSNIIKIISDFFKYNFVFFRWVEGGFRITLEWIVQPLELPCPSTSWGYFASQPINYWFAPSQTPSDVPKFLCLMCITASDLPDIRACPFSQ